MRRIFAVAVAALTAMTAVVTASTQSANAETSLTATGVGFVARFSTCPAPNKNLAAKIPGVACFDTTVFVFRGTISDPPSSPIVGTEMLVEQDVHNAAGTSTTVQRGVARAQLTLSSLSAASAVATVGLQKCNSAGVCSGAIRFVSVKMSFVGAGAPVTSGRDKFESGTAANTPASFGGNREAFSFNVSGVQSATSSRHGLGRVARLVEIGQAHARTPTSSITASAPLAAAGSFVLGHDGQCYPAVGPQPASVQPNFTSFTPYFEDEPVDIVVAYDEWVQAANGYWGWANVGYALSTGVAHANGDVVMFQSLKKYVVANNSYRVQVLVEFLNGDGSGTNPPTLASAISPWCTTQLENLGSYDFEI